MAVCHNATVTHLLISDGRLLLIGQLHQRAHVRAQVCLAANQQDPRAGTEVQDLGFPLWKPTQGTMTFHSWLRGGSRNFQEKWCHLLQAAIHSVGATDVKAEQDGV